MKRYGGFVVLLCVFVLGAMFTPGGATATSISLRIIHTIQPQQAQLMRHDSMRAAIIHTAGKQELGKFYTISLYALLREQIEALSPEQRNTALIVLDAAGGSRTIAALAEFDPQGAVVPAILLIGESEQTRRDSVVLGDIEGLEGMPNLDKLHEVSSKLVRERFYMPNCHLSDAERARVLTAHMMVLFPADRNAKRWPDRVRVVHLALLN